MVSGSSLPAYWLGHYVGDCIFQTIPAIVAILGILAFGLEVPGCWILFLTNIFANPVSIYCLSFLFDRAESGSLAVKIIYFLLGIIAPITISVLQVVNSTTIKVSNVLRWFFYPFPIYSLTSGYMSIANIDIIQFANKLQTKPKSFDAAVAGYALIFLLASIAYFWLLIVCFEMKVFELKTYTGRRENAVAFKTPGEVDEDITEETQRVAKTDKESLPVRLHHVSKNYGSVQAVKEISFGLEFGECFALLGVSGAGKTTLFKCLTGEIYPSSGSISIIGSDVTTASGFQEARRQIGYCPQFDAIFEGLTVREHLEIYATLKGVKRELRDQLIEKQIDDMDLRDYTNIHANNLSGGNKRKMSVAMAMIGNPPLIFLDEPSTGVDPQAKRFMWNIVSKISTLRKRSAVIITTHSMEEAEALCTKMGIMVGGEFKCFGSSTHIKDKFGTGYELEVKIRMLTEDETKVEIQKAEQAGLIPFTLESCKSYLKQSGSEDLINELNENGIGSDFYEILNSKQRLDPAEFIRWQFTESRGKIALDFLEKKFKEFTIIEHYNSSWKLKVSRDNYSIGYLFGMMEDI